MSIHFIKKKKNGSCSRCTSHFHPLCFLSVTVLVKAAYKHYVSILKSSILRIHAVIRLGSEILGVKVSASSDIVTSVEEWSLKTNAQSRPICFSFQHLEKNFNQSQQIYVYEQI